MFTQLDPYASCVDAVGANVVALVTLVLEFKKEGIMGLLLFLLITVMV